MNQYNIIVNIFNNIVALSIRLIYITTHQLTTERKQMTESMIEAEQMKQREDDIENMSYELRDHTNRSTNINNDHFMCENITADEEFMNALAELITSNKDSQAIRLDDFDLINNLRCRAKELADEIATNERG